MALGKGMRCAATCTAKASASIHTHIPASARHPHVCVWCRPPSTTTKHPTLVCACVVQTTIHSHPLPPHTPDMYPSSIKSPMLSSMCVAASSAASWCSTDWVAPLICGSEWAAAGWATVEAGARAGHAGARLAAWGARCVRASMPARPCGCAACTALLAHKRGSRGAGCSTRWCGPGGRFGPQRP